VRKGLIKIQLEIELYYKTKEQLNNFLNEFHKELVNLIRSNFYGSRALKHNILLNSYKINKNIEGWE